MVTFLLYVRLDWGLRLCNCFYMEIMGYGEGVASRVISALDYAGVTRKSLCQTGGFVSSVLARKLNGVTPFTVGELAVIANVLGLPVEDLLPPLIVAQLVAV
jgi:lambda repressor-like predicted transcriptional regulator